MLNLNERAQAQFNQPLSELSHAEIYKILLDLVQEKTAAMPQNEGKRKLYYISAEFLIGKLLSNNLLNLGLYDDVAAELAENGTSLAEVEEAEAEPSLGNGGLGRLAACFLDSIATLGLNGDGVGLNYHFGLFRQYFEDNKQSYEPDEWLDHPTWLSKSDISYKVPYGKFTLQSTLYEIDVPGYNQPNVNKLRLFDLDTVNPEIIEEDSINFDKTQIEENLTLFLYPDDSDRNGNLLRIYQQYFMVSNGAQLAIQEAIERGSNIHDLADYVVVQINDTHPTFIIPEFVRLLTTEHGIDFEEAVEITRNVVAFTNHTILSEALEKWPLSDIHEVVPEIAEIITKLDEIIKDQFPDKPAVQIIDQWGTVHMASIAIHFGFSINGVAALHTEILKNNELNHFYEIYPEKFSNKTNGITFRRWLMASNPSLTNFIDEHIGTKWREDADLTDLLAFENDDKVLDELRRIKKENKNALADHLQRTRGINIDRHSIVDVQIKRIHEYKRQQMLALYIIYKYHEIKAGHIPGTPITIIFGGKAAPAYTIAKDIIHLILALSELIENDLDVAPHLKVVFVDNYNVSEAEYLIPAANISEQISLASKEASGTGNMKFMLNGALTIMTWDGANVEIAEQVGEENVYPFGKSSEEIVNLYATDGYDPQDYYKQERIQPIVDFIISDELMAYGIPDRLHRLYNDMTNKDYFMALIDLEEFIDVKEKVYYEYEDRRDWTRRSLINIANAGYFSADRTIEEYNNDIWHLDQ
ncbi:glycogen/starch/alpha-glucan phosphorylase [Aerococcus urinaeequi]|uniref:glycogen/starch/alpha-glucan phosphorylase n=1 Tax=Aerococcus urinaeequi TaxID=51665 RepID=UPI00288E515D|nr:glycogen/starch/alpha-glucan phosphorylase [Aerococcus urinaeequi]MDT2762231.1 glycogen/starch/alpha-glucan phosphorylase [Aerococcus urinaeequi]